METRPRRGGEGQAGPAGRARLLLVSSVPLALCVLVPAGESRCTRGGAGRGRRLQVAPGGRRPARDPQPKAPRGRGGAAGRQGGQVRLPARAASRPAPGEEEGDCPFPSWTPARGVHDNEVTPAPGSRAPGAPQRAAPCWRETSVLRGCPPRKTPRPVSIQGRRRVGKVPGVPSARLQRRRARGGTAACPGLRGAQGAGDRDPCPRVGDRPPRCSLVRGDTLSAAGHWGHPRTDRPRAGGGRAPLWALPGRPAVSQSRESIPQPCPVHRQADGRISDVFTGAINTHNISVLFWRFICDIK